MNTWKKNDKTFARILLTYSFLEYATPLIVIVPLRHHLLRITASHQNENRTPARVSQRKQKWVSALVRQLTVAHYECSQECGCIIPDTESGNGTHVSLQRIKFPLKCTNPSTWEGGQTTLTIRIRLPPPFTGYRPATYRSLESRIGVVIADMKSGKRQQMIMKYNVVTKQREPMIPSCHYKFQDVRLHLWLNHSYPECPRVDAKRNQIKMPTYLTHKLIADTATCIILLTLKLRV